MSEEILHCTLLCRIHSSSWILHSRRTWTQYSFASCIFLVTGLPILLFLINDQCPLAPFSGPILDTVQHHLDRALVSQFFVGRPIPRCFGVLARVDAMVLRIRSKRRFSRKRRSTYSRVIEYTYYTGALDTLNRTQPQHSTNLITVMWGKRSVMYT